MDKRISKLRRQVAVLKRLYYITAIATLEQIVTIKEIELSQAMGLA